MIPRGKKKIQLVMVVWFESVFWVI